jgi:hypothetical protein
MSVRLSSQVLNVFLLSLTVRSFTETSSKVPQFDYIDLEQLLHSTELQMFLLSLP